MILTMNSKMKIENNDLISDADIKSFMRLVVEQAQMHPIIYKYLTYNSGCQMLQNHNIQFTRGDKLNDIEDLNISKFNIDAPREFCKECGIDMSLIDNKLAERANEFKSFGICSLGISPLNSVLWNRYTHTESENEDGICIGLNQEKVINALIKQGLKTACIVVRYKSSVANTIPWLAFSSSSPVKIFAGYQFFALKNLDPWEPEQEIRLVYTNIMTEEYHRIILPKDCFESVYFGKDMNTKQRQFVGQILSRHFPKIKPIPLTEYAFTE